MSTDRRTTLGADVEVVVATLPPPPQRLGVIHWSSRLLAAELGVGLRRRRGSGATGTSFAALDVATGKVVDTWLPRHRHQECSASPTP